MRAIIKGMKDVYALDLGTTKFCLACVRPSNLRQHHGWKVDTISVPAEGMRRGMVSNIDAAKTALDQLIVQAEQYFCADIRKVVVGIAGSHLRGKQISSSVDLHHGYVNSKDISNLCESTEKQQTAGGREVLHTIPLGYCIDDRTHIESPMGLHGKKLVGNYFLIDADQSYLRDVLNVCNASGLQVLRFYSEPIASASVTIPDELKMTGIAMADIGGGTTDGIVFQRGKPVSIFTINIAGKLMTNDLSIGLSIPFSEAEKAKIYFGISSSNSTSTMNLTDLHGRSKNVSAGSMNSILLPRVHELGVAIGKSLLPYRGALAAGLFLTGGGSEVRGLPEYYMAKMGIPVHIAKPQMPRLMSQPNIIDQEITSQTQPPKLATVLGLINLELGRLGDQDKYAQTTWSSKYLGPILNWLKEMA